MCLAHQSSRLRNDYVSWITPYFRAGDLALTLTFPDFSRQYKSSYVPNYDWYNSHVRHYLNKVHRVFLGRTKTQLNRWYSFELNYSHGVHLHMILEAPPRERIPLDMHKEKLIAAWTGMKYTGNVRGVDIQQIYDVGGWVEYITKDLKTVHNDSTAVNPYQWHFSPRFS